MADWSGHRADGLPCIDERVDALEQGVSAIPAIPAPAALRYLRWNAGATALETAVMPAGAHINVKDAPYSAVGDGVADDTAAIQAALTAGAGKSVYIPQGRYRVTASLSVPQGTSVFGASRGSGWDGTTYDGTTITIEGADATIFVVTGRGSTIKDVTLLHTGATASTSGALIDVAGHYHTIAHVNFGKTATSAGGWIGARVRGAVGDNVSGVQMLDLSVRAMKSDGVYFERVADASLLRYLFENVEIGSGVSHGITLYGETEGVLISHAEVLHASVGLWLDGTAQVRGSAPGFNQIAQSFFDSCNWGIYVNYGFQTLLVSVWSASNSYGLWLERGQGIQVVGGQYFANTVGITLRPGVLSTVVKGAQIRDNVTAGVQVQAGVTDFIVQGNDFTSNLGPGAIRAQAAAVTIAAGASDRYVVADNLIRNSGAVTDAGAGVNKRVANNY